MSSGHRTAVKRARNRQPVLAAGTWKAIQRNAAISAFKVRPTCELVVGKSVAEALNILTFEKRRGSAMLRKVLQSAVANASDRGRIDPMGLVVKQAVIDEAFAIRRFMARGRGRSSVIERPNCHITVVVGREN